MLPSSPAAMTMGSLTLSKTMSAARTMVRGGVLVSVPFATSDKPFVRTYPASIAFGMHDAILNPPNKDRTTTVRATYTRTAVTTVSAGTTHKRSVPYSMHAARNRVRNDAKRIPPPFASTLSFDMGVVNKPLHPYRTINSAALAPSAVPMTERLGFTNGDITSALSKRLHKPLYS